MMSPESPETGRRADLDYDPNELMPPLEAAELEEETPLDDTPATVFDPVKFERFCAKLWIDSKELGLVRLKFLGSQRYLVQQIAQALGRGIHTFVILKGRQIGISTVLLALDIYWLFKHKGLQGAMVTDTDDNRETFRSTIELYIKTLPPKAASSIRRHNRYQMMLKNRSRCFYLVAGTKKKGDLGRAKAVNFMHATECSSWGDEEGFGSLMNTLAQQNPNRLYVFESTARGYNMFYQTWEVAKDSPDQCAIFIGWWLNELYSFPEESPEYKAYWDGELTGDERVWVREVFEKYGVEITAEQLVWWRWYVKVTMKGDEMHALQEMPPTEDYAFQLSGSKYFSAERVNAAYQRALTMDAVYFRYAFGKNFEDTQFLPCERGQAEVTIWATPARNVEHTPDGKYVLGADPAYGSSAWADEFAGSLCRCYADRLVQVAEIGTPAWTDMQFAWVLMHLAGWYGNTMLNLEMQGPGGAVFNEIWNMKKRAASLPAGDPRAGPFDVLGRVRDYLWHRQDTMHGNFAYQWQTSGKEKVRLMSTLRSHWEREGVIEVNSPKCIEQFRNIHQIGDQISGEGRAKDDRVIALAIANIAWNDWVMLEMIAEGRTYEREHRPTAEKKLFTPVENSVIKFLDAQKVVVPGLNDRKPTT
jgi:hypothetical protein